MFKIDKQITMLFMFFADVYIKFFSIAISYNENLCNVYQYSFFYTTHNTLDSGWVAIPGNSYATDLTGIWWIYTLYIYIYREREVMILVLLPLYDVT